MKWAAQLFQFPHRLLEQPEASGGFTKSEFARDGHGAAPGSSGHVVRVGPIAHPADPDTAPVALREIVPGNGGVEVRPKVGPERGFARGTGGRVGDEDVIHVDMRPGKGRV